MSDLFKVFTRERHLEQRRVLFEVHSANHDEQESLWLQHFTPT